MSTALIIEPNHKLIRPYAYLSPSFDGISVSTVEEAVASIGVIVPNLVLISASLPPSRIILLLENIKNNVRTTITPVLFIVDVSHRDNFIPGVWWDSKLAVLDSEVSESVFVLTIDRIVRGEQI